MPQNPLSESKIPHVVDFEPKGKKKSIYRVGYTYLSNQEMLLAINAYIDLRLSPLPFN